MTIDDLINSLKFTASTGNNAAARVMEKDGYKAHVDVYWDETPTEEDVAEFNRWLEKQAPVHVQCTATNLPEDEEQKLVSAFLAPEN